MTREQEKRAKGVGAIRAYDFRVVVETDVRLDANGALGAAAQTKQQACDVLASVLMTDEVRTKGLDVTFIEPMVDRMYDRQDRVLVDGDGKPVMSDEETCEVVAAALRTRGFDARDEHTGGGIWCVYVDESRLENAEWVFGMADEMWGGALMKKDASEYWGEGAQGTPQDSILIDTEVPSDSTDSEAVAAALGRSINAWRAAQDERLDLHGATAETLAARFVAGLRKQLTVSEWNTMAEANREERVSDICHSHDHCDSNMVMFEAFEEARISATADVILNSDRLRALWNDAWTAAKPLLATAVVYQEPATPVITGDGQWIREFGTAWRVPDLITNDPELEDISWHNDAMPSFTVKAYADFSTQTDETLPDLRLWVDHVVPESRENGAEWVRFAVSSEDSDVALFLSETDVAGAVAELKTYARQTIEARIAQGK